MRNYFPYENGHQWLLEQGEDLEAFVFSMYEFCTNDLAMHGMALASAYTVLSKHRGENGLYGPLYEGRWEVLSEHFKPY